MKNITYHVKVTKNVDYKYILAITKKVQDKFKKRNLDISFDIVETNFDESDEKNYGINWTRSFHELKLKVSIKTEKIRELHTGNTDGVILFVDGKKARANKETRGEADTNKVPSTIEIYSMPKLYVYEKTKNKKIYFVGSNKKRTYQRDEYVLIHEILHLLSIKYTDKDLLHSMIEEGKFEDYFNHVVDVTVEELNSKIPAILKMDIVNLKGFGLLPLVERRVQGVFRDLAYQGFPMRVIEGYRSPKRQDELFKQVPKVTNARAGESLHQYGVALDCNFLAYGYNAPEWLWKKFGNVAKNHGFEWGGDWENFQDRPHIEMTLGHDIIDFKNKLVDYSKFN